MHRELSDKLEKIERQLAGHEGRLGRQAKRIAEVFDVIRRLMALPEKPRKRIGFLP